MNRNFKRLLSENTVSDIENHIVNFLFDNYSIEQMDSIGDGKNSIEVSQDPSTGDIQVSMFDNRLGHDTTIYHGPEDLNQIEEAISTFMGQHLNEGKKVIKLTESDLKQIIRETIESALEGYNSPRDEQVYALTRDLLQVMDPEMLIAKLGESMGFENLLKHLQILANRFMPDNY